MNELELGWAAGMFEGEGTITTRNVGRGVLSLTRLSEECEGGYR
jgi:hypothetical protein